MFQYLQDNKGITTGVFIPIEDWQILIEKYGDLQINSTTETELSQWQKDLLDQRLEEYHQNPNNLVEFDAVISKIRSKI